MNLYQQRMQPVWNQLKRCYSGPNRDPELRFNRALLKDSRQGNYLIKMADQYHCLMGIGYLNMNYRGDNWGEWSTRKNAQWFTKEEALELTKSWKGVKFVKR